MKQRQVWFSGKFVPESEARISIYDSALIFGDMVFEMTRSFKKKQFKLREHLERLYASIRYVHIPLTMTLEEMEQVCCEVVEKNEPIFEADDEHRLMINVSRGPLSIYRQIFNGKLEPTVVVADFPLRWTVQGMGKLFDIGIHAVTPDQHSIPADLLNSQIKHRSRLHLQMANIQVSEYRGDNHWALLCDPNGFIAEGTGSNFFMVRNRKLYTPEPGNVLKGISRAFVFELAERLGFSCFEKKITPKDVDEADEAFMTGTPFCILPVTQLNDRSIGNGAVGEVTKLLLSQWSEEVGVDIIRQIKAFNEKTENSQAFAGVTPYRFGGTNF